MTTKEKSSVLELNGKPYDARTGFLLVDHPQHRPQHYRTIDGVINSTHQPSAMVTPTPKPPLTNYKSDKVQAPVQGRQKAFDIHRTSTQPTAHHRPQHAVTLMRNAVAQPSSSLKRRTKVTYNTDSLVQSPQFDIVPKLAVSGLDKKRLQRAERVAKSKLINRFSNQTSDMAPLTPTAEQAAAYHPNAVAEPSPPAAPVAKQASAEIFERAMEQANSHKQLPHKHKKVTRRGRRGRRLTSLFVSGLAVLLILGFIAYQNTAVIQVHIAAARSGINATLPSWQPTGFAVKNLTYKPGTVAINFDNSTNNKDFSIIQTASHWSSTTALFNNYVYPNSNNYEAVKAAGKIIYTYNNNAATWISSGIWYKVISNGALSTSQLINIAVNM
ncbi:MAG: hypothetical protein ACREF5_00415 [Candidatus Saccharimonadales bacterium]